MYNRVLLKLTGELFGGSEHTGISYESIKLVAETIAHLKNTYILDLAIVLGAGNLFRGREFNETKFNRTKADFAGMTGTIMNGVILHGMLDLCGIETRMMSSLPINRVCEEYIIPKAINHLRLGRVVILAGGLGRPFTTTDTAAAQCATELDCQVLLKGSNVDGIYTADPKKDTTATRFETLSYHEALMRGLTVMDDTAFALCKTNNIPIIVFDIHDLNNIERIIRGEKIGTLVS